MVSTYILFLVLMSTFNAVIFYLPLKFCAMGAKFFEEQLKPRDSWYIHFGFMVLFSVLVLIPSITISLQISNHLSEPINVSQLQNIFITLFFWGLSAYFGKTLLVLRNPDLLGH